MAKYLDSDGLLYFWQKLKTVFAGKVDKVEGKGLSTNDYTGAESPSWRASPQMQITTRTPPPAAIIFRPAAPPDRSCAGAPTALLSGARIRTPLTA